MRQIYFGMTNKQVVLHVSYQGNLYVESQNKSDDVSIKQGISGMKLDGYRVTHKYF